MFEKEKDIPDEIKEKFIELKQKVRDAIDIFHNLESVRNIQDNILFADKKPLKEKLVYVHQFDDPVLADEYYLTFYYGNNPYLSYIGPYNINTIKGIVEFVYGDKYAKEIIVALNKTIQDYYNYKKRKLDNALSDLSKGLNA